MTSSLHCLTNSKQKKQKTKSRNAPPLARHPRDRLRGSEDGRRERKKMIKSKADLQRALQAKRPLTFTTIKNECKPELEGITRTVGTIVQGNAFTLATEKQNGYNINDKKIVDSWIWYCDIDVKNNVIKYKKFNIEILIKEA